MADTRCCDSLFISDVFFRDRTETIEEMKFKLNMLDYCKIILSKISFDKKLFRKEYRKTFEYLRPQEQQELKKWLRAEHLPYKQK